MTPKERARLRGLANGIDAVLQIGKDGIGENLIHQADITLEARELIKCHALDGCMDYTPREAAETLARATGSEVVQVIGSKFVLYRKKAAATETPKKHAKPCQRKRAQTLENHGSADKRPSVPKRDEPRKASTPKRDEPRKASAPKHDGPRKASTPKRDEPRKASAPKHDGPRKAFTPKYGGQRKASAATYDGPRKASAERNGPRKASAPKRDEPRKASAAKHDGPRKAFTPKYGGQRKASTGGKPGARTGGKNRK